MPTNKYKHDVALSFTQKDEHLAFKLYKLLRESLNCFIYSEEQKNLAGKDGGAAFNEVFEKDSRIVVILYRDEWGKTKWTRIEETAIKNRGFEDGYDFTILIPLDNSAPPKWLPKNRLWIGLERWGIESAASVIEARVQEFDGVLKVKSIADFAEETEAKIRNEQERKQKINLENGLLELSRLYIYIEQIKKEIETKSTSWKIQIKNNSFQGWNIHCYGFTLSFQWYQQYGNTLTNAFLQIFLFEGYINERGEKSDPFNSPKNSQSQKYSYHINEFDEDGWKFNDSFYISKKLVEIWMLKFVQLISDKRLKNTI